MTDKEKAKAYDEAIERAKDFMNGEVHYALKKGENIMCWVFPQLRESDDERLRKALMQNLKERFGTKGNMGEGLDMPDVLAWFDKQGEQKPNYCHHEVDLSGCSEEYRKAYYDGWNNCNQQHEQLKAEQKSCMIQWKGDNLKEVIDFTGKDKNFEKWFKSFEEYEKYVSEHNGIFKLFNEDSSHYEVPVGAWIVKTPDGYNVASKAVLKQKPWSEEDEYLLDETIKHLETLIRITKKHGSAYSDEVKYYQRDIDWLKSLKERVQPKQEWSEEDRKIIIELIGIFESAVDGGHVSFPYKLIKDYIRVLKSCLPQTTWKPSEEQMEALLYEVYAWDEDSINGQNLKSLYQDLKKLREE